MLVKRNKKSGVKYTLVSKGRKLPTEKSKVIGAKTSGSDKVIKVPTDWSFDKNLNLQEPVIVGKSRGRVVKGTFTLKIDPNDRVVYKDDPAGLLDIYIPKAVMNETPIMQIINQLDTRPYGYLKAIEDAQIKLNKLKKSIQKKAIIDFIEQQNKILETIKKKNENQKYQP